MDIAAQAELHAWLSEQGFSGSPDALGKKLVLLELESRCRLCWDIWRGRFHTNKRVIQVLAAIQALGIKHFEYHSFTADHLILGSMEFSTPKPRYAHRPIRAISVRLDWVTPFSYSALEIRIIFRYGENDGIRDRYLNFSL